MPVSGDFRYLRTVKDRCISILPLTSGISIFLSILYLSYRLKNILDAWRLGYDMNSAAGSVLYLLVEVGLSLPNLLSHVFRCLAYPVRDSNRTLDPPALDMMDPPSVDVLITCAGESLETILDTVEAACALNYPPNRFRIIVLDDAASDELSAHINSIKQTRQNIFYTARKKGRHHHFKAGNLNHGYELVEKLEGGPGSYIAALDADMIPEPQWLRVLIPYLIADPEIGLVQPPQVSSNSNLNLMLSLFQSQNAQDLQSSRLNQRYFGVPTPDLLLQGLEVNYRITEPLRESMGSTWCGGSGYVVRREALRSIGGFPTESIAEDMYCSNVLHSKGWKTFFVDRTLQHGRVPDSFNAHTKQQSRWVSQINCVPSYNTLRLKHYVSKWVDFKRPLPWDSI